MINPSILICCWFYSYFLLMREMSFSSRVSLLFCNLQLTYGWIVRQFLNVFVFYGWCLFPFLRSLYLSVARCTMSIMFFFILYRIRFFPLSLSESLSVHFYIFFSCSLVFRKIRRTPAKTIHLFNYTIFHENIIERK